MVEVSEDSSWVGIVAVVGTSPGGPKARVVPMSAADADLLTCLGRSRPSHRWLASGATGSAGAGTGVGAGAGAGAGGAPVVGVAVGLSLPASTKDVFDWRGAVKEHVDADTVSASTLRAAHAAGLRPFVDAVRSALREGAVPGPVTLRWCVAQCLRLLTPLSLDAEGALPSDGNLVVAALKGLVATDRVSAAAHPKLVPTALRLHQLVGA